VVKRVRSGEKIEKERRRESEREREEGMKRDKERAVGYMSKKERENKREMGASAKNNDLPRGEKQPPII